MEEPPRDRFAASGDARRGPTRSGRTERRIDTVPRGDGRHLPRPWSERVYDDFHVLRRRRAIYLLPRLHLRFPSVALVFAARACCIHWHAHTPHAYTYTREGRDTSPRFRARPRSSLTISWDPIIKIGGSSLTIKETTYILKIQF